MTELGDCLTLGAEGWEASRTRPSLQLRDGIGGGVIPGMGLGRSNKYGGWC